MRTITIHVTQEDIEMAEATGGPNQPQVYRYCPDAWACNRDLLYAHPDLFPGVIGIEVITYRDETDGFLTHWGCTVCDDECRIADLPLDEVKRINAWDNGQGMTPHEFTIEVEG